jgi:hypothetical protein
MNFHSRTPYDCHNDFSSEKAHNGATDKPRKARKPQAFSPEVGSIRVVVRRFAPSNHADCNPPPRCRGREASATTFAFSGAVFLAASAARRR